MKKILFCAALAACMLVACNKNASPSLVGVYQLDKQWISGGGTDSTYERTQIKIYTDHQFIYAGMTPDSVVNFGVGTYKQDTAYRVTESEFYSSYRLDTTRTFHLVISTNDKGFTEKIPDIGTSKGIKYALNEDYSSLPSAGTAPKLDGLWKMEKSYAINGKDTLNKEATQYKIFKDGHFLYAGRYLVDRSNKFRSTFGYGSCSLKDGDLVEQNTMSSDPSALTHQFNIKITFNGDDAYTQVISDPKTGQQSIETYARLK